jgi:hypothetical protein
MLIYYCFEFQQKLDKDKDEKIVKSIENAGASPPKLFESGDFNVSVFDLPAYTENEDNSSDNSASSNPKPPPVFPTTVETPKLFESGDFRVSVFEAPLDSANHENNKYESSIEGSTKDQLNSSAPEKTIKHEVPVERNEISEKASRLWSN